MWNHVCGFGQEWLDNYLLMAVDAFVATEEPGFLDDFVPSMLNYYTKEGKLYGLPYDTSGDVLYYNKDLLKMAGVDIPRDSWTFEGEFLSAAKKVMQAVPTLEGQKVYGTGFFPIKSWIAPGYFACWGGGYIDEDLNVEIDSPGGVAAMQYFVDLAHKHNVMVPLDEAIGNTRVSRLNGRVPLLMELSVRVGTWDKNVDFEYGVAKLPAGPVKQTGTVFGGGFVITAATKHPEASWELLKFITSENEQTTITAAPGLGTPGRFSSMEALSPKMRDASNVIGEYEHFVSISGIASIWGAQSKEFELAWLGQQSPEDALKAVAQKAREVIKENYGK